MTKIVFIQMLVFQMFFVLLFGAVPDAVTAQSAEKPQTINSVEKKMYDGWALASLYDANKNILEYVQLLSGKSASALSIQMKDSFYIEDVDLDSPAESAGLEMGDVIVSFNGKRFKSFADYEKWLEQTLPDKLTLVVYKASNDYKKSVTIDVFPKADVVEKDDRAPLESDKTLEYQRQLLSLRRQFISRRKDMELDLKIAQGDTYGKSNAQIRYEKQEIESKYMFEEKKAKIQEETLKKLLVTERRHLRNKRDALAKIEQKHAKERQDLEVEILNDRVEKEKEWREKESHAHPKLTESEKQSVESVAYDKKSDLFDKDFEAVLQQIEMPKNQEYFPPETILKQIDVYNEEQSDLKLFVLNISPKEKQSLIVYLLLLQKIRGKKYNSIEFKYILQHLIYGKEKFKEKLDVYAINKIQIDEAIKTAIAVSKSGGPASLDDVRILESMLPESNRLSGNAHTEEEEERLAKVKRKKEKDDLFK
jgi:hypothetical protein